jgi:predicted TIM-barrel fold metal-dependent hydrolase
VDRPDGEADAEVPQPLLLDERVRAAHYPKNIVDFANTRGADKILYAGYFPMGLSLERIFGDMPSVAFRDHVWPKFLRENAMRVLKL